jgi:nicotinamide riboside transporter PnuC
MDLNNKFNCSIRIHLSFTTGNYMVNINWAGEAFDIIASLAGKYGQWLNSRGKRLCFIIWSICMLYWSARDFNLGLYSQSIFCVFSLAINFYGYFNWKKQGFGENKTNTDTPTKKDLPLQIGSPQQPEY